MIGKHRARFTRWSYSEIKMRQGQWKPAAQAPRHAKAEDK